MAIPNILLFILIAITVTAWINSYREQSVAFMIGLAIYLTGLVLDPTSTGPGLRLEGIYFSLITILVVFPLYFLGSISWLIAYIRRRKGG